MTDLVCLKRKKKLNFLISVTPLCVMAKNAYCMCQFSVKDCIQTCKYRTKQHGSRYWVTAHQSFIISTQPDSGFISEKNTPLPSKPSPPSLADSSERENKRGNRIPVKTAFHFPIALPLINAVVSGRHRSN